MQDKTLAPFRLAKPEYEAARQDLLKKYGTSRYNCGAFTSAMAQQFPELKRIPGFYLDTAGGASHGEHWWLEDARGNIIDPTADQFPTREWGHYVKYDPNVHCLTKGRCPNCGMELCSRESAHPCSAECDEALAEEYGSRLSGGPYECDMEFETDAEIMRKYGMRFAFLESMGLCSTGASTSFQEAL